MGRYDETLRLKRTSGAGGRTGAQILSMKFAGRRCGQVSSLRIIRAAGRNN
jgi:hypothetical protein